MPGVAIRFRSLTTKALRLEMAPVEDRIEKFLLNYLNDIKDKVQPYPPVPSGSRYRRTGSLFRGWSVLGSTFNATLTIDTIRGGSRRQYPKWVYGDKEGNYQMIYHQAHGWKRLVDFVSRDVYRNGLQNIYNSVRIK